MASEHKASEHGTVEELLEQAGRQLGSGSSFDLWVPKNLTSGGEPVSLDEAMAIVDDAVLAGGYAPAGFSESASGRLYKYTYAERSAQEREERSFPLAVTLIVLAAIVAGFLIVIYR
jgi:hypothetical protein